MPYRLRGRNGRFGRLRGRGAAVFRSRASFKRGRRSRKGGHSRRSFKARGFRSRRAPMASRKRRFLASRRSRFQGRRRGRAVLSKLAGLRAPNSLYSVGQKGVSAKLAKSVFSILDSRIPPVDYRRQGWGILDCGMGHQSINWPAPSSTNSPTGYLFNHEYLDILSNMTDAGLRIAHGFWVDAGGTSDENLTKFEIMHLRNTVTVYNPNTGPVYLRFELYTPRGDRSNVFSLDVAEAEAQNPRWEGEFIGASFMDMPYMSDRWKYARKPKVVKIAPGATVNFSWRNVKRSLSINRAAGRFANNYAGNTEAFRVWRGLSLVPVFTIRGPPALNGLNTSSDVAEGSFVGARLLFMNRQRTVWRPQMWSGASDFSGPIFNYADQFPDEFTDDGAPIVSSYNTVKLFDDDDITPAGGNQPASAAGTPDKRVWTHNT